jgi:hypothetical protein
MELKNSSLDCPLGNLSSAATSENSTKYIARDQSPGLSLTPKAKKLRLLTQTMGPKFAKCFIGDYGNDIRST